jgi:hypothetical protein
MNFDELVARPFATALSAAPQKNICAAPVYRMRVGMALRTTSIGSRQNAS